MRSKEFDIDPYPGKPKILFIGHSQSTHTHSWIDLLSGSEFNIRLFGVPTGYPPDNWKIRTYVTIQQLPEGLDPEIRRCLHPTPEEWGQYRAEAQERDRLLRERDEKIQRMVRERDEELRRLARQQEEERARRLRELKKNPVYRLSEFSRKRLNWVNHFFGMPQLYQELGGSVAFSESSVKDTNLPENIPPVIPPQPRAASAEAWLAEIIQEWQPDIIHTLGLDHDQGGFFYYGVRNTYGLEKYGKWVLQLRGGSDLTLNRHVPETATGISKALNDCDQIICDNTQNIVYAEEMGVPRDKFADIVPIPGTGGLDVETLSNAWTVPPSRRERIILWPKAYETPWSKALPVLEAFRVAWERIRPCTIYMTAAVQEEIYQWFQTLPLDIKQHCHLKDRIPREQMIELMRQARVLLIPSLVDGVPNSLYEGMACGTFPIVSPLDTICPVVAKQTNVLFARNLYPLEIAEALVEAMGNDGLVDAAAHRNLELVKRLADRAFLGPSVIRYYNKIAQTGKDAPA